MEDFGLGGGKGGEGGNTLQTSEFKLPWPTLSLGQLTCTFAPNLQYSSTCSSTVLNSNAASSGFASGCAKRIWGVRAHPVRHLGILLFVDYINILPGVLVISVGHAPQPRVSLHGRHEVGHRLAPPAVAILRRMWTNKIRG